MMYELGSLFVAACTMTLAVLLFRQVERWRPVHTDQHEITADWKVTGVNLLLASIMKPLAAVCGVWLINLAGGGLIHLRIDGIWYYVSVVVLIIATDFFKYWSHRAEHAIPFLWEMHSLHHSAKVLTFATSARHFWIERLLILAFVPVLPIVFYTPPEIAGIIAFVFGVPDSLGHLNIKVHLGRATTWINNPQWHRIHHSSLPEHRDKNFITLLPLWDILFGTAWVPKKDEYPPSGLDTGEDVDAITSIIWPFRHWRRRSAEV